MDTTCKALTIHEDINSLLCNFVKRKQFSVHHFDPCGILVLVILPNGTRTGGNSSIGCNRSFVAPQIEVDRTISILKSKVCVNASVQSRLYCMLNTVILKEHRCSKTSKKKLGILTKANNIRLTALILDYKGEHEYWSSGACRACRDHSYKLTDILRIEINNSETTAEFGRRHRSQT